MTGIFITFEGIDGSGKTTQVQLLDDHLKQINKDTVIIREPGGTEMGEKIRNLIIDINNDMADMTEALLYAASRAQLIEQIIKPSLEEQKIVLCDRFIDSSIVYQGIARELGVEKILNINRYAIDNIMPNITFYLDILPELGIKRKKKQTKLDRIESEDLVFHNKVYEGYQKIALMYPKRIYKLDATQSKDKLHNQICTILNEKGVLI